MNLAGWQKIDVNSIKPYSIFLGAPLEELGEYLAKRIGPSGHILIITHPHVKELYAARLLEGLKPFRVSILTVPPGEEEKSLERLSLLTTQAVHLGADRKTVVIALGGGVIGDLAGFFASVFMRGVRLVQVPTTLLAQVDSSIGGKVAVNHPAGKNLIGAFYPPLAVWTDFTTLETLPWVEMQNGLAETVKHALIADQELFDFLEKHQDDIINYEPSIYREMTSRSLAVKVKIVSEDEKEEGRRMLLNLGHSFGHALETAMAYRGITHGQGVSVGIVAAAQLALERGLMSQGEVDRIFSLLRGFGLPVSVKDLDPRVLLQHMSADKKNREGRKVLVLPKGIGTSVVMYDCQDEEILQAWEKVLE